MNYRKSYYILLISFVAGILLMYLYVAVDLLPIAYLGMALMIGGLVQMVKFFRCPHCGKLLHPKRGLPKNCTECGKEL